MGFDARQISYSPFATIGLAIDAAVQQSVLCSSYYANTNFPNMDYLLDPRFAFEQTVKKIQANPIMYMPPTVFSNYMMPGSAVGDTFNLSNLQMPQFPWMQPTKPESKEEKEKREAKEAEDKKQEADDAKDLKAFLDEVKKFADNKDNHVSLPSSVMKKAEDALKKEKAADRLAAMQEIIKGLNPEIIKKVLMANDELKSKLVDAGFKMSKYIEDSKLYVQGSSTNGIASDIRNHSELKSIHDKLKKEGSASGNKASVNYEFFKPFAESLSKDNILGFISNWNDKYNDASGESANRSFLRYIANNLPDKDSKVAAEKAAVNAYVDGINAVVRALVTKAQTWDGNYPKLDKDIKNLENIQRGLKADNLTQAYVNKLAGAFESLYVRLRVMEAEKINNSLSSNRTYKLIKAAAPDGLKDNFVTEETKADLTSEGFTSVLSGDDIDKIEKSSDEVYVEQRAVDDLDEKYENDAQGLANALASNEHKLLHEVKKDGKVAYYKTNSLDNESGKPLVIRYFKVIDNKLVEVKPQKSKDGKTILAPDKEPKTVTAREIREYNDQITRVNDLVEAKKIIPLTGIDHIIPKYPMYKAAASDDYFIWRNNELVQIKNVESITGKNGNIHIKIKGAETSVLLDTLMENDDNFDSFDNDDLKTVAQVNAEKEEKQKLAAQKKKEADYKKKHPYDNARNEFNGAYADLTANKLKSYGLEELDVLGWFVSTSSVEPKTYYRFLNNKLVKMPNIKEIKPDGSCITKDGGVYSCPMYGDSAAFAVELQDALAGDTDKDDENTALRILRTFVNYKESEDIVKFIEAYEDEITMFQQSLCTQLIGEMGTFSDNVTRKDKTVVTKREHYVMLIAKQILNLIDNNKDIGVSTEDRKAIKKFSEDFSKATNWNELAENAARRLDNLIKNVVAKYRAKHPAEEN